jgi:protoporphyrin/coproporphyrin ferrochelatase
MRFTKKPVFSHATSAAYSSTAVLLCNLGTPDEPTPNAVKRYLAEFLSDSRVVELPRWAWWPILHGIILQVRPRRSAHKYASIWLPQGSPLKVWTAKLTALLQGSLGQRGQHVLVRYAMRYGPDGIAKVLDELHAQGVERILILPLYPQYSAATSASVFDAVYQWAGKIRRVPELRFINRYHDQREYIEALAASVRSYVQKNGQPQKLILSFHGMPHRTLLLGDSYFCECHKTARLLRETLGWRDEAVGVTFQSRFGRAKWLQPYTEPTLVELARQGLEQVAVMCPGFAVDCLETLEEIAQEARDAFLAAGGKQFDYIPCLNDDHKGVAALSTLISDHLQGWPLVLANSEASERIERQQRAVSKGALQ